MAQIFKVLAQSNPAINTLTDIYTVPALTEAVLSTIMVANRGATKITVRIAISIGGAIDNPKQYIAYDLEIDKGGIQEFTIGITLATTDVVRVFTDTANASFNVFGTEITS